MITTTTVDPHISGIPDYPDHFVIILINAHCKKINEHVFAKCWKWLHVLILACSPIFGDKADYSRL